MTPSECLMGKAGNAVTNLETSVIIKVDKMCTAGEKKTTVAAVTVQHFVGALMKKPQQLKLLSNTVQK